MDIIKVKRGDTYPPLEANLTLTDGSIIPLTDAIAVAFKYIPVGQSTGWVNRVATITDADAGTVTYDWQAADTATAGRFNAEFEITFLKGSPPTSVIQSVPTAGHIPMIVYEDIS